MDYILYLLLLLISYKNVCSIHFLWHCCRVFSFPIRNVEEEKKLLNWAEKIVCEFWFYAHIKYFVHQNIYVIINIFVDWIDSGMEWNEIKRNRCGFFYSILPLSMWIGYYYYHTSNFNSRVKMANGSILFYRKTKSNYTIHSASMPQRSMLKCKHIVCNFSFDFKSFWSFLCLSYCL